MSELAGEYTATVGSGTMTIVDSAAAGELTATINDQVVGKFWVFQDQEGEMTLTQPLALSGSFVEHDQSQGEVILFVSLSGRGPANDGSAEFPVTLSLVGYMNKNNPDSITMQAASAFEFTGNPSVGATAEDIWGHVMAWRRAED